MESIVECLWFKDRLVGVLVGGFFLEGIRVEDSIGEVFLILCCIFIRKCKNN